jgi:hypothetical protein
MLAGATAPPPKLVPPSGGRAAETAFDDQVEGAEIPSRTSERVAKLVGIGRVGADRDRTLCLERFQVGRRPGDGGDACAARE